jgi:phenylalanyl-tRNA synthetase beta chain
MTGNTSEENWLQPPADSDIFLFKSMVIQTLKKAGIRSMDFDYSTDSQYFNQTIVISSQGKELAVFGAVKSTFLKTFDLEQPVFFADLFWNQISNQSSAKKFELKAISSFPSVRRDLALLLDQAVTYGQLETLAYQSEPNLIRQINLFDVYQGDKIASGKKSYAMSFVLQDDEKTLTDQDIDGVMNKLIKKFSKEFGAELRM